VSWGPLGLVGGIELPVTRLRERQRGWIPSYREIYSELVSSLAPGWRAFVQKTHTPGGLRDLRSLLRGLPSREWNREPCRVKKRSCTADTRSGRMSYFRGGAERHHPGPRELRKGPGRREAHQGLHPGRDYATLQNGRRVGCKVWVSGESRLRCTRAAHASQPAL